MVERAVAAACFCCLIGLRWIVPAVYELRTDVAVGEGGTVYFHLGVGNKLSAQRSRLR